MPVTAGQRTCEAGFTWFCAWHRFSEKQSIASTVKILLIFLLALSLG
jgi:hypothetical protein